MSLHNVTGFKYIENSRRSLFNLKMSDLIIIKLSRDSLFDRTTISQAILDRININNKSARFLFTECAI